MITEFCASLTKDDSRILELSKIPQEMRDEDKPN